MTAISKKKLNSSRERRARRRGFPRLTAASFARYKKQCAEAGLPAPSPHKSNRPDNAANLADEGLSAAFTERVLDFCDEHRINLDSCLWEASPGVKEFAKKNGRSTDESKRQIERIHEAIEKGEILGFTYGKYGFFLVA